MSPSCRRPSRLGPRLLGLLLWSLMMPLTTAWSAPLPQPWMPCLHAEAHRIGINPILYQAVIHTESRANPLAFGWTDHRGQRHSWSAPTQEDATLFLHRLLQTQRNFDSGLTQINVQNIPRLTKQLGIHPLQILDPCTNLTMSAIILEEAIAKHGNTWRAIAAYNGSLDYIPLVWTNLCRVHAYPDCPPAGTVTARAHPPAPTEPLRLTRAMSSTFTPDDPESAPLRAPLSRPHLRPRPQASDHAPWFDTADLQVLLVNGLVPFSWLIAIIVVLSLGLRIILWALRGVRTSYARFTAIPIPSHDLVARHARGHSIASPLRLRTPQS